MGVFERFKTCTQYHPATPPMALANVNEGTLYMPGSTVSGLIECHILLLGVN